VIRRGDISRAFFYFGYFFMYAPLFLVIIYSFNSLNTFSWGGFSWKWYKKLIDNHLLLDSALVSCKVAALSATLSVLLGTLCASQWTSVKGKHKRLGLVATLPLVIPEMVLGLSLLLLWVWLMKCFSWLHRGFLSLVVAHTLVGTAYVTALVRTRLARIDPFLSEAALDLGAKPYKVFLWIKMPLALPTIIAGWLLAFILSFDDVVLASFATGPGTSTLPLVIFSSLRLGYNPEINALGSCIICFASLLTGGIWYIIYRKSPVNET